MLQFIEFIHSKNNGTAVMKKKSLNKNLELKQSNQFV